MAWVGFPPNPAQAGVSTEVLASKKNSCGNQSGD
jgi:hypothetical protein